jgi:hypothetical protein
MAEGSILFLLAFGMWRCVVLSPFARVYEIALYVDL